MLKNLLTALKAKLRTKPPKKAKKLLLALIALILIAAIIFGIWFVSRQGGEVIAVYPFEYLGMTEYWGDNQESYGPVTTDRIQTVFLSDTQEITEVLVSLGDQVKKDDVLMTFDTTLSGLQLERKRLEVEKLKLQLDAANAELKKIRNMKPMQPIPEIDIQVEPPFLGETLSQPYKTYLVAGHDGKSMETAFICWLQGAQYIDDSLLETLRMAVWQDSGLCRHGNKLADCVTCNCTHGPDCEVCVLPRCPHGEILELCPSCRTCIHGDKTADCPLCSDTLCTHGIPGEYCVICYPICPHGKLEKDCTLCSGTMCAHGIPGTYCRLCYCEHGNDAATCETCHPPVTPTPPTPTTPTAPTDGGTDPQGISAAGSQDYFIQLLSNSTDGTGGTDNPASYYVIFKVTQGNTQLGAPIVYLGAHVQGLGQGFQLNYFTPATADYTLPEIEETEIEMPDYSEYIGSGYTSAQIAQMRKEQEKKIKDLELKHKMLNAEYKIMLKELGDGTIRAEFDGEIVSLLSPEEAKETQQPMVKLSDGGGFHIEGAVSELEKENLKIGQTVTVNDWRSGGTYEGTVKSIGDFPSQNDSWNGMGNPTATYYPFTVFVGEEADLQSGSFVSIQYSTSGESNGIYLEKAFLRTEQGQSYVYALGSDGRLEKRYVTTGKSLWGSYMEILSGLSETDKLAFPYGKGVKDGARAEERDISELYMY